MWGFFIYLSRMEEMITKFKDYSELPFSKEIQAELFKRHQHNEEEQIIYSEEDVLILLQLLQSELKDA